MSAENCLKSKVIIETYFYWFFPPLFQELFLKVVWEAEVHDLYHFMEWINPISFFPFFLWSTFVCTFQYSEHL